MSRCYARFLGVMNEHIAALFDALPLCVPLADEIMITGGLANPDIIEMKQRLLNRKDICA